MPSHITQVGDWFCNNTWLFRVFVVHVVFTNVVIVTTLIKNISIKSMCCFDEPTQLWMLRISSRAQKLIFYTRMHAFKKFIMWNENGNGVTDISLIRSSLRSRSLGAKIPWLIQQSPHKCIKRLRSSAGESHQDPCVVEPNPRPAEVFGRTRPAVGRRFCPPPPA